jgi:hypothetical protein
MIVECDEVSGSGPGLGLGLGVAGLIQGARADEGWRGNLEQRGAEETRDNALT